MSAVMERERRVTAGKRMTFLAGQELENDEAFWTHDTWQEDNESFHSSDAASSAEEDVFDSDFDASENEEDDIANEEMIGAAMERDIQQEERDHISKKRNSAYTETSHKVGSKMKPFGGRRSMSGPNGKRVVGDGLNAGIVLNVPPQYQSNFTSRPTITMQKLTPQQSVSTPSATVQRESTVSITTNIPDPKLLIDHPIDTTATIDTIPPNKSPEKTVSWPDTIISIPLHPSSTKKEKKVSGPTLAATRIRRTSNENKNSSPNNYRSRKSIKPNESKNTEKSPQQQQQQTSNGLKRGKQTFTQEELLLEAVQVTEPENERWILGQKRNQAMKDDIEIQLRNNQSSDKNTKVIEKFVSRRGYFNTITFPDMDHIPYVLQRRHPISPNVEHQLQQTPVCIITGKPAKFRDPKTGYGYYDIEAFRELRRRYEAHELPVCKATEVAGVHPVHMNSTAEIDSTPSTGADVLIGRATVKVQKRAKSMSKVTGSKRKIVTNGRKVNGKEVNKSIAMNDTIKLISTDGKEDVDNSSLSKRPRIASTGGESINANIMINLSSKIYDYETLSPSTQAWNHSNNGNNCCNGTNTNTASTIASPPLSPTLSPGRKSPRTPKPTAKLLENAARAIIPALSITEPQSPQHPLPTNHKVDDDAIMTSAPLPSAPQQPSESVKN
jgi:hypothetical protein